MLKYFESVIDAIMKIEEEKLSPHISDSVDVSDFDNKELNLIRSLNSAFLTLLSGSDEYGADISMELINQVSESGQWKEIG